VSKTEKINESLKNKTEKSEEAETIREQQLATELELVSLIRENTDILERHPELLSVLEVPHQTGAAVSLIERQVGVLRQQLKVQEKRLLEVMDVARDNERLTQIRHRLSLSLLSAHDTDDVVSLVLDTLTNELSADHAVIKLFTKNQQKIDESSGLFVNVNDEALKAFKTMLEHKNTVCGKSSDEQKTFLFGEQAEAIKSAAIIPLISGANLGLIGLGANSASRFNASMGTEFLSQTGELISASLAVHLEE